MAKRSRIRTAKKLIIKAEHVDELKKLIDIYLTLPESAAHWSRPLPNPSEGKVEINGYEFVAPRPDSQGPQKYLNIDGYDAGPLYLTDNIESRIVSPGNKLKLRTYKGRFRALDQRDDRNFKVIIFSPLWLSGKPTLVERQLG
jgi:hypothetical protein